MNLFQKVYAVMYGCMGTISRTIATRWWKSSDYAAQSGGVQRKDYGVLLQCTKASTKGVCETITTIVCVLWTLYMRHGPLRLAQAIKE